MNPSDQLLTYALPNLPRKDANGPMTGIERAVCELLHDPPLMASGRSSATHVRVEPFDERSWIAIPEDELGVEYVAAAEDDFPRGRWGRVLSKTMSGSLRFTLAHPDMVTSIFTSDLTLHINGSGYWYQPSRDEVDSRWMRMTRRHSY